MVNLRFSQPCTHTGPKVPASSGRVVAAPPLAAGCWLVLLLVQLMGGGWSSHARKASGSGITEGLCNQRTVIKQGAAVDVELHFRISGMRLGWADHVRGFSPNIAGARGLGSRPFPAAVPSTAHAHCYYYVASRRGAMERAANVL